MDPLPGFNPCKTGCPQIISAVDPIETVIVDFSQLISMTAEVLTPGLPPLLVISSDAINMPPETSSEPLPSTLLTLPSDSIPQPSALPSDTPPLFTTNTGSRPSSLTTMPGPPSNADGSAPSSPTPTTGPPFNTASSAPSSSTTTSGPPSSTASSAPSSPSISQLPVGINVAIGIAISIAVLSFIAIFYVVIRRRMARCRGLLKLALQEPGSVELSSGSLNELGTEMSGVQGFELAALGVYEAGGCAVISELSTGGR